MLQLITKRPWLILLNLLTYTSLLAIMGSCAHYSTVDPISNLKDIDYDRSSYVVLQYQLVNLPNKDHKLYFRDTAGDLIELDVEKSIDHQKGFIAEFAKNRGYQLEAIGFGKRNFLLKDLTQEFHLKAGTINYLGAMKFELKNGDLVYSVLPPMAAVKALKTLEQHLDLTVSKLINPYTGKNLRSAKSPSRVRLRKGKVRNSFANYIETINPCYVKEWKKNPIILGQLNFQVSESNGILRVKNAKSNHSASDQFEQCVWTKLSDAKIADKNFRIQIPGILYF